MKSQGYKQTDGCDFINAPVPLKRNRDADAGAATRRQALGLGFGCLIGPLLGRPTATLAAISEDSTAAAWPDLSYIVMDSGSGQVLDALNPDQMRIPASLAKIPTTIAAWNQLGPGHRFATGFQYGKSGGKPALLLQGNDPSLDIEGLSQLVASLPDATGALRAPVRLDRWLVDAGDLPRLSEITPTQSPAAPYNPGIATMALNFNRARLVGPAKGGRADGRVELCWTAGGHLVPVPSVELGPARAQSSAPEVQRPGGREIWTLVPGFEKIHELPIGDPLLAIGTTVVQLAQAIGITLPAPSFERSGFEGQMVAWRDSPPLEEIISGCLHYSNNLVAEMLALQAQAHDEGKARSLDDAGRWVIRRLTQVEPRINWQGARLENGSGLGTGSRLSVRQIAEVLLSQPSLDGWLKPIGPDRPDGLRVKTGTLAYVRGLAGRFSTGDGGERVFAILAADTKARSALDQIMPPALDVPPASRVWLGQAKRLEAELLARWGVPASALAAITPSSG